MESIETKLNWILADRSTPPIDENNADNKEDRKSADVLTISKYGVRWGRFYHRSGRWKLDGISVGGRIMPKYWAYLTTPDE